MRSLIKFLFYRGFCPFLLFTNIDRILRWLSKNKRMIIMYHGVTVDNQGAINGRHLPVDQFEKQLIYLKKNFAILPLTELCEMKLKRVVPEKHTIALTFDDGFLNNISNALPLLEKYQIPATFFICSASLETLDYIHPPDFLDLINFSIPEGISINGKHFKKGKYHMISSDGNRSNIYDQINDMDLKVWTKTFSELQVRFPHSDVIRNIREEYYKLINSAALPALGESSWIAIGSHGHLHINLARLTDDEIEDQLGTSKEVFSRNGVRLAESLVFPYGEFSDKVLSVAKGLGYKYLIAGGSVQEKYAERVFPRVGILNLAGYSYNMLSINRGFGRFGF